MRDRVFELMRELRAQRKQIEDMKSKAAAAGAGDMLDGQRTSEG